MWTVGGARGGVTLQCTEEVRGAGWGGAEGLTLSTDSRILLKMKKVLVFFSYLLSFVI